MPTKPTKEDNGSFDDLLDNPVSVTEKEAVSILQDGGEPAETPEQARIRELEAKIELLVQAAAAAPVAPLAAEVKSEDQKNAEHRAAVAANTAALAAREAFEVDDENGEYLVFHVIHSGFTFADRVWWVGQNVKLKRGGRAWQETLDRNGNTWLDDISLGAQLHRFGRQMVAEGPWTGPAFNDAVDKLDSERGNAAPVITIN